MITAQAWAGKHYAVYGLARSGQATVRALLASGARVTAWDEKEEAREALSQEFRWSRAQSRGADGAVDERPSTSLGTSGLDVADFTQADLTPFDALVVSPGVPLNTHPLAARAREAGIEIIGDIELFARARPELPPHKVVGITGTNGKSTTTALVHHILKTAGVPTTMGGNIGLPILGQEPLSAGGVYVLELSSYQIDLTQSLDCDVAVLLNITPDHLDRYESFEAYAASKARLFEMQSSKHIAYFDASNATATAVGEALRRTRGNYRTVGFYRYDDLWSFDENAEISAEIRSRGKEWSCLKGPHNASNALAASNVAFDLGVSQERIDAGLETFRGLPHRSERVRDRDGVLFVNDSKATNAEAAAPALAAYPHIRWIVGGRPRPTTSATPPTISTMSSTLTPSARPVLCSPVCCASVASR